MNHHVINVNDWIEENEHLLQPPVCNKLMHNGQLSVMFVGGPNIREDYHIEEGEELFYMIKGDMCLKVFEKGERKDIHIKEGEIFLLPSLIPHSPQRQKDTVGLVIERERLPTEKDILRYYCKETTDILYEKCFCCQDLGTQLAPIIDGFFKSEPYKTGVPDKECLLHKLPFLLDETTSLVDPVPLKDCLETNDGENPSVLFAGKHQFDVKMYSEGQSELLSANVEHWLWQLIGTSVVTIDGKEMTMKINDTLLVPPNTSYTWKRKDGSKALNILQDGSR